MHWIPKRTLAESTTSLAHCLRTLIVLFLADEILCAPGMLHELEYCLVNGQLYRVYKHLWPSLREFWLLVSEKYKHRTYIVFEQQRWTYAQIAERSLKAASLYRHIYRIKKGDTIGICSRNFPDYLVAFWACHLIGAVPVLANALVNINPKLLKI